MTIVLTISAIWIGAFLTAFYPARRIGPWIVHGGNNFYGFAICLAISKLFVVCAAILFSVFGPTSLSHVRSDAVVAIVFSAVLFWMPVFCALVLGFLRARREAPLLRSG